jgi:hypothetical protein
MAKRLVALPQMSQVLTLSSFVSDDQEPKLAMIQDADTLLDPTLNPFDIQPAPTEQRRWRRFARPRPPWRRRPGPAQRTRADSPLP